MAWWDVPPEILNPDFAQVAGYNPEQGPWLGLALPSPEVLDAAVRDGKGVGVDWPALPA